MHVGVQMSGKIWGAYPFQEATVSVEYSNRPDENRYGNRLIWHGYFVTHWVGKPAPHDVYLGANEKPVFKRGEIIEHSHAAVFADYQALWFDNEGWSEYYLDFLVWCYKRFEEQTRTQGWESEEISITIHQLDTPEGKQPYSFLGITKEMARWLGETLIKFANETVLPDEHTTARFSFESCPSNDVIPKSLETKETESGTELQPEAEETQSRVLQFPDWRIKLSSPE